MAEKELSSEALQNKLTEARQEAQATLYEKEQQITSIKTELEKVTFCLLLVNSKHMWCQCDNTF